MATCIEFPAVADKPAKNYLVSTAKIVAAAVTYLYGGGKSLAVQYRIWVDLRARPAWKQHGASARAELAVSAPPQLPIPDLCSLTPNEHVGGHQPDSGHI